MEEVFLTKQMISQLFHTSLILYIWLKYHSYESRG